MITKLVVTMARRLPMFGQAGPDVRQLLAHMGTEFGVADFGDGLQRSCVVSSWATTSMPIGLQCSWGNPGSWFPSPCILVCPTCVGLDSSRGSPMPSIVAKVAASCQAAVAVRRVVDPSSPVAVHVAGGNAGWRGFRPLGRLLGRRSMSPCRLALEEDAGCHRGSCADGPGDATSASRPERATIPTLLEHRPPVTRDVDTPSVLS